MDQQYRYPDFLRHIVNPKLSTYMKKHRIPANLVDEIKKNLIEAENKYGFSSFGGNPEKLRDYLNSSDFKLLISIFRSGKILNLLEEILQETREKYYDLKLVVETIEKILRELETKQ